ncbi:peptidoglycan-binding domain-containing protein [Anaerocolumna jejuensis]|uniref:peptidoglycan-binding domain-containing protein n=1 Tax=Anaerocolumna jejuensis TaxID=259063 RepID=UPI00241C8773|nr:peptidoglycan-binding domain-containing protein [Anaerocolumna jejuensis]
MNNGPFGPFGTGFRSLKPGDRGADVLAVQERLKELRYYKGNMTGIFGEDLKNAVHRFQEDKNLEIKNTITREDYDAMGLREFE